MIISFSSHRLREEQYIIFSPALHSSIYFCGLSLRTYHLSLGSLAEPPALVGIAPLNRQLFFPGTKFYKPGYLL